MCVIPNPIHCNCFGIDKAILYLVDFKKIEEGIRNS